MYDTTVTLVGNALNSPEIRQTGNGTNVTSFRVASTSRRYDRDTGRWVDGPSLRVRVTCWRRLAESVHRSVFTGDPLIVTGRMYTRDWIGEDNQHRVSYELEAVAVGHDMARGQSDFKRHRANNTTSAVEDAEADVRIRGEVSQPVAAPVEPGGESYGDPVEGFGGGFGRDAADYPGAADDDTAATTADDAAEVFRAVGLTAEATEATTGTGGRDGEDDPPGDGAETGTTRRRGRARVPQPA
jgi:single-strand DNA-binding protein